MCFLSVVDLPGERIAPPVVDEVWRRSPLGGGRARDALGEGRCWDGVADVVLREPGSLNLTRLGGGDARRVRGFNRDLLRPSND